MAGNLFSELEHQQVLTKLELTATFSLNRKQLISSYAHRLIKIESSAMRLKDKMELLLHQRDGN